ncbi:hypothetical protein ASL20_09690 [Cupriavidus necator]|uniref:hypothetical protein n=1 Tax=Cupriavidus necator TaxID=106590 RepID=UPI0007350B86|nr:hypothetical protein [Cupriavidus necator]KUE88888.1 hypothetical protein ASL20_09690 [Cupriavidus necator]
MSSFRKPTQIRRRTVGRWEGGRWIEGDDTGIETILASVQPVSLSDQDELQARLEGRRIEAAVRIYTTAVLNVAGADDRNGDRLIWPHGSRQGDYLVVSVSPWQSGVISHYRYHAVLELEP